jgi:hypothetical protein
LPVWILLAGPDQPSPSTVRFSFEQGDFSHAWKDPRILEELQPSAFAMAAAVMDDYLLRHRQLSGAWRESSGCRHPTRVVGGSSHRPRLAGKGSLRRSRRPLRAGAGASAKEAFFYLLIFSTLAIWMIGFARLAFALIDRWKAHPLFYGYQQTFDTYTVTSSLPRS